MRYSSINKNPTATILRGPRGRTRGVLSSFSLGVSHQTPTFSPPTPEIETSSLQKPQQLHIPTDQLVNQIIQQTLSAESSFAFSPRSSAQFSSRGAR